MYMNEPGITGIKEINQYYAKHGGRRSAAVKGFANYIENAGKARIASAGTHTAAHINTASLKGSERPDNSRTDSYAHRQTASKDRPETEQTVKDREDTSRGACCDKCELTSQLMLRMMGNHLYTQSGLGYPAVGSGALTAWQSLSKYFGNGVFS